MARARNIKPGFFKNEDLAECQPLARILFAGLWTIADREGRLEDRPKKIKAEVLPYDACDIHALLDELVVRRFVVRYERDGVRYMLIPAFVKHQNPHSKEAPSTIPPPSDAAPATKRDAADSAAASDEFDAPAGKHSASTVLAPEKTGTSRADSLIPDPSILGSPIVVDISRARAKLVVDDDDRPPMRAAPGIDSTTERAVRLATLLRAQGAALQPADPRVRAWAECGVSDEQAAAAMQRAIEARHDAGSAQPITAGYLDAILANEPKGAPRGPRKRFDPSQFIADRLARGVDDAPARPPGGDVWDAVPEPLRVGGGGD